MGLADSINLLAILLAKILSSRPKSKRIYTDYGRWVHILNNYYY